MHEDAASSSSSHTSDQERVEEVEPKEGGMEGGGERGQAADAWSALDVAAAESPTMDNRQGGREGGWEGRGDGEVTMPVPMHMSRRKQYCQ